MRSRFPQGIPMQDGTTSQTFPYPEGSPPKPDWIALDPVANAEWDRICTALAGRRALSPAWMGIIAVAASAYSHLVSLTKEIREQAGIEGADELVGSMLSTYFLACKECQVEPHPTMTLRDVASGVINRED